MSVGMKYAISTGDKWLIGVVAVVSVAVPFVINYSSAGARTARVIEQGVVIKNIDLTKDADISIKLKKGFMDLEVRQGRLRANKCSCPEKVCMGMGWIGKTGQSIVCVPNKTLVEVRGSENIDYDAVAY
jgi:hypothetical protein